MRDFFQGVSTVDLNVKTKSGIKARRKWSLQGDKLKRKTNSQTAPFLGCVYSIDVWWCVYVYKDVYMHLNNLYPKIKQVQLSLCPGGVGAFWWIFYAFVCKIFVSGHC